MSGFLIDSGWINLGYLVAAVFFIRGIKGLTHPRTAVQGNMDPVALFAPVDDIARRVNRICDQAGPLGHVFNLGHGVLPSTPIEGVEAVIAAVKARSNP